MEVFVENSSQLLVKQNLLGQINYFFELLICFVVAVVGGPLHVKGRRRRSDSVRLRPGAGWKSDTQLSDDISRIWHCCQMTSVGAVRCHQERPGARTFSYLGDLALERELSTSANQFPVQLQRWKEIAKCQLHFHWLNSNSKPLLTVHQKSCASIENYVFNVLFLLEQWEERFLMMTTSCLVILCHPRDDAELIWTELSMASYKEVLSLLLLLVTDSCVGLADFAYSENRISSMGESDFSRWW